jgi:hypothetical protein
VALAAIIVAMTASAHAQAPSAGKACSAGTGNGANQNLSDKLQASAGVICPPNVDPAMKAPTPPTGDKPAIPPPAGPQSK